MKNKEVIKKFIFFKENNRGSNLYAIDNKLYSYNTAIAQYVNDIFIFNNTKYSRSTTRWQNVIKDFLQLNQLPYKEIYNIPKDTMDLTNY